MVATRIEEKGLARQLIHLLKGYGPQDEDLADKVRDLQCSMHAYHHAPLLMLSYFYSTDTPNSNCHI